MDGGMAQGAGATSSPAMTCAGVMALAVAHGAAHDPDNKGLRLDPRQDAPLRVALNGLSTCIGHPTGRLNAVARITQDNGGGYYFLWSLERACMALGLETLGGKDWFKWGAEILVANQAQDGSWTGQYAGADTCFALLFLARSNLTGDLTNNLRGRLRGLGQVELKAGGVGGKGLKDAMAAQPRQDDSRRKKEAAEHLKPIPTEVASTKADKLGTALVDARGGDQERLLKEMAEAKGVDYTEALALAIPRLEGDARGKAREALADRLTRMTANTLKGYLTDPDPEIRRAAVLAAAMKDLRELVPHMIERLDDGEPQVVRAAHAALKAMSNRDYGPAPGASPEEHKKAIADWKDWWKAQGGK
jgi:hypothetical protein